MKNHIVKILTLVLFVTSLASCTVGYRNGYRTQGYNKYDRYRNDRPQDNRYHNDRYRQEPSRYNSNHY